MKQNEIFGVMIAYPTQRFMEVYDLGMIRDGQLHDPLAKKFDPMAREETRAHKGILLVAGGADETSFVLAQRLLADHRISYRGKKEGRRLHFTHVPTPADLFNYLKENAHHDKGFLYAPGDRTIASKVYFDVREDPDLETLFPNMIHGPSEEHGTRTRAAAIAHVVPNLEAYMVSQTPETALGFGDVLYTKPGEMMRYGIRHVPFSQGPFVAPEIVGLFTKYSRVSSPGVHAPDGMPMPGQTVPIDPHQLFTSLGLNVPNIPQTPPAIYTHIPSPAPRLHMAPRADFLRAPAYEA